MSDDHNEKNIDEDSLLLLLRDAIVQHSSLNDIKLILRYLFFPLGICILINLHYSVVNM